MTAGTWSKKLKQWLKGGDETFAKAIMSPPEHTTLLREIPSKGVVVIVGQRRKGKTGLAFEIMDKQHTKKGMGGALFLPLGLSRKKKTLLPSWVKVITDLSKLPKHSVVIIDEASQVAHARRSQSKDAVTLDALVGISEQKEQLIIFISHHGRKLDLNLITESNRILWKEPTQAHVVFERPELQMFTRKALEFFGSLKEGKTRLKTTFIMDFNRLRFATMTNGLPSWWNTELSHLFEDTKPGKQIITKSKTKGVKVERTRDTD